VSFPGSVFEPYTDGKALYAGVRGAYPFTIGRGHPIHSIPGITDPIRTEASRQSLQDQEDLREPAEFRERPEFRQRGRVFRIRWGFHPRKDVEGNRPFYGLVRSVEEPAEKDTLACLVFSSGTTGPPTMPSRSCSLC
jgi:hypothetical protein